MRRWLKAMCAKSTEPRKHHYISQCWLAGFTENGKKTERFFVTDLVRRKQWTAKPAAVGYKIDLYRASDGADPVRWETKLGEFEQIIAPLFRRFFVEPGLVSPEELYDLQVFAAIQFIRLPAFRPFIEGVAKQNYPDILSSLLRSREHLERVSKRCASSTDLSFEVGWPPFGRNRF